MSYRIIKVKGEASQLKYSEAFRRSVVAEYERGLLNKDQIQAKYGIKGNSRVLEWCRRYGKLHYPKTGALDRPIKDPQKQRIEDLEKQLAEAKLKLVVYEKLIEIAEPFFGDINTFLDSFKNEPFNNEASKIANLVEFVSELKLKF